MNIIIVSIALKYTKSNRINFDFDYLFFLISEPKMSLHPRKNFFGRVLCYIGMHKYKRGAQVEDLVLLECERCEYPKVIEIKLYK